MDNVPSYSLFGAGSGDGLASEAESRTPWLREPIKCSGEGAEQHSLSEAQEMGLAGETLLHSQSKLESKSSMWGK